ncbi:iron-containing redox enzyme family protein [Streptomyces sp. 4N509B]|uniref:iron-containing redox enzyme family protein n=1 Tax=Streptomyces sp. 4N509B TaxID=3457413 RepID=UPI003FCFAF47
MTTNATTGTPTQDTSDTHVGGVPLDYRSVYLRALDPEGPPPLSPPQTRGLHTDLTQAALPPTSGDNAATTAGGDTDRAGEKTADDLANDVIDAITTHARELATTATRRFQDLLTPLPTPSRTDAVRCILINCAPLALSAGAWLQWISSAANAETEPALAALALYAGDLGVGYPHADRGSDYRALLRRHRLGEPFPGVRLASSSDVDTDSFRLPALLLAMSRRPDTFTPEILGADLALRATGLLPPLAALTTHGDTTPHAATAHTAPRGDSTGHPSGNTGTTTAGGDSPTTTSTHSDPTPATPGSGDTGGGEADLTPAEAHTLDLGGTRPGQPATALKLATTAVHALITTPATPGSGPSGPDTAPRVTAGAAWALNELHRFLDTLATTTALTRHPDYAVWRLIYTRARPAAVYHSDYLLAGRPLSAWFNGVDDGPGPFLNALATSPLVRPGKPDRSPLVRGLINEKGPMFRVFTDEEITVLRQWISRLPEPDSALNTPTTPPSPGHAALTRAQRAWHTTPHPHTTTTSSGDSGGGTTSSSGSNGTGTGTGTGTSGGGVYGGHAHSNGHTTDTTGIPHGRHALTPRGARTAYTALLARTDTPALRAYAHAYITRWLARSRYRLDKAITLPDRWDRRQGLKEWLAAEHDRHAPPPDTLTPPPPADLPTREEVIDSTLQLAPLIMIDGGWLQGFTDYHHASSRAGHFLYRTYWDELGNGDIELNHPRIYRALLSDMGIDLPPTASPDFAAWPGFTDNAFATPVYWLCLARFPQTFQPEILGVNLAMELSGVGGGYTSAAQALAHYGYSTQFVDLHNTIDNVATGHSAWAIDAIDSYMTDLPTLLGHHHEPTIWHRIRLGYRSLNPPTGLAATLYAAWRHRRTHPTPTTPHP